MIASALLATTLAATSPQTTVPAPAVAVAVDATAQSTAKPAKAAGKMDCCKDGCECCGKDKAAKAEAPHEHAH